VNHSLLTVCCFRLVKADTSSPNTWISSIKKNNFRKAIIAKVFDFQNITVLSFFYGFLFYLKSTKRAINGPFGVSPSLNFNPPLAGTKPSPG